ncbi:hypothetical protein, partial [Rubricoccus marinus]
MAAPPLTLIGHLARASSLDDADSIGFTLNLSAAFDAGSTDPTREDSETYLRPWTWGAIDETDGRRTIRLRVTVINNQNPTNPDPRPDLLDVIAEAPRVGDDAREAWRGYLEERFTAATTRVDRSTSPPTRTFQPKSVQLDLANGPHEYEYEGTDEAGEGSPGAIETRFWHAELLDLSRSPAPLSHDAGLSWRFRVPTSALEPGDQLSIAAAPVLSFPTSAPPAPEARAPATSGISFPSEDRVAWPYDAPSVATEPTVTLESNHVRVDAHGEERWVALTGASFLDEDWMADLELRAAELFDLAGLLVRYLSDLGNESRPDAAKALAPLIRASLRDLAQTGATRGQLVYPGAPSSDAHRTLATDQGLAADLFRAVAPESRAAFSKSARHLLEGLEAWEETGGPSGALEGWWTGVCARALGIAPRVLTKPPDDHESLGWKGSYEEALALHAHVRDDVRARELLLEQWTLALGSSLPATVRDTIATDVLPNVDVPRALGLMHLGPAWDTIAAAYGAVPATSAGGVPEGVAAAYETEIKAYARRRAELVPDPPAPDP